MASAPCSTRPERTFLGSGTLTAGPAPGMANLNRPDLVVLTNPRLLPCLSQVMDADPHRIRRR